MSTIGELIDALAQSKSEAPMAELVANVREGAWTPADVCQLASVLAASGTELQSAADQPTADVASTGGPGSLSTLLCPLYLRNLGFVVPKLGVPGRPAGGIDVLAQLRGYKVELSESEIREVIQGCGYAHFLAGSEFAPLDAALFRFRQTHGAQNIPALAVASILAKKIACGVAYAGLDVRVALHGNFGADYVTARAAATDFCVAAKMAGIAAVAGLTDARTPNQPYIGRGEALLALKLLFQGQADPWLSEHDDLCRLLAAHVAALASGTKELHRSIGDIFQSNVAAQGGTSEAFEEKTDEIARVRRRDLTARKDGFFVVDLERLRSAFVAANAPHTTEAQFPDKVGLILRKRPGTYVRRGDVLASVRADEAIWVAKGEGIEASLSIVDFPATTPKLEGVVHA